MTRAPTRVLVLGAAGRDFHDFATVLRDDPDIEVVGFTAARMAFGAGAIAARDLGASEVVDPRPHAVGRIADAYQRYPHIGATLPAVGYSDDEIRDLEATIRAIDCDSVVIEANQPTGSIFVVRLPRSRSL